jgi:phage baseplate assembly protein W
MPVEFINNNFKDLSFSFQSNPLNSDLIALKNQNAIARALRNIILTEKGEKFFNPLYGTGVNKLLFDNLDPLTASSIKDEITFGIENFEPRVELKDVIVNPNYDENKFDVIITYTIIGIPAEVSQLSFALLPTR